MATNSESRYQFSSDPNLSITHDGFYSILHYGPEEVSLGPSCRLELATALAYLAQHGKLPTNEGEI